jgi:hypothetical protein
LVDGWATSIERHDPGKTYPFHYHTVEEWLEVRRGAICFFSASGCEYRLVEGMALWIPQGEVHRVEVGSNGVDYRMWTPVEVSDGPFAHNLDPDFLALIETNLKVPQVEDNEDRESFRKFFDDFLAPELTFRTAPGGLLRKDGFLARPVGDVRRESSGSVCILHASSESLLLATVVHTRPRAGGPRSSFANIRLFVKEGNVRKCLIWLNYPQPMPGDQK